MNLKHHTTTTAIAVLLTALFSYAALSKMIMYDEFAGQLERTILTGQLSSLFSWIIPTIELFTVILLIVPDWRRTGLLLSSALMLIFSVYIATMLLFAERLPCSCGGVFEKMSWTQHLVFNIIFFMLALVGYLLHEPKEILSR